MKKIGENRPSGSSDNLSQTFIILNEGVYADDRPTLRTESHQIFTRYSQIIADKAFEIRSAIFQSISECQGDE